jgi:hypothetical protein
MQSIVDALNNLQLHPHACDKCDTLCDVPCLVCNGCVTCNADYNHWPSSWSGNSH